MIVGLGIDCEEVSRWEGLTATTVTDPRYPLFTQSEHKFCSQNPYPAQHYAGRWCVKEACVKALATLVTITTRDVEVLHQPAQGPKVVLVGRATLAPGVTLMASVTHSEKTAAAVVLAQRVEGG
jgi:holo-[acyl-carrier protein] synthase